MELCRGRVEVEVEVEIEVGPEPARAMLSEWGVRAVAADGPVAIGACVEACLVDGMRDRHEMAPGLRDRREIGAAVRLGVG